MTRPRGELDLPAEPPEAPPPAPLPPLEPFEMETVAPCVEGAVSLTKPSAMSSAF